LVGPGALVVHEEEEEEVVMGHVDKWPVGFYLGGSTLSGMNGPYTRVTRDHTLPYDSHVTIWNNPYTGWSIVAGQNADQYEYDTPYDNSNGEWLLIDAGGVPRLGCAGGSW
jgi:hypothetical protein